MKTRLIWIAVAAVPLLLSACSGDDDTPTPATQQLSPDASKSPEGLVAYIQALIAETDAGRADDKEPVDLSTFVPPTSEDKEPVVLSSS